MFKNIKLLVLLICVFLLGGCAKSIEKQVAEQLELGQRYLEEGDYEAAIVAFSKAIELEPKTIEAYIGRGDAHIGSGETHENVLAASQDYEEAVALDDTNTEVYYRLGGAYESLADMEDSSDYIGRAEEAYRRMLELNTLENRAFTRLFEWYHEAGELEKLVTLYNDYGDAASEEQTRQIEKVSSSLSVIERIAQLCEAEDYNGVFEIIQSEDYEKLRELSSEWGIPMFAVENGKGVGLYPVKAEEFGNFMIYYGDYQDGVRQGHGVWMGYMDGNNYRAVGEWDADAPNGEQETREWYGLLAEDVTTRVVRGSVTNGRWNGPVQWIFERTDGSSDVFSVSFTDGKWNILEETESDDGGIRYRVSEDVEGLGILTTENPDEIEGIQGFIG